MPLPSPDAAAAAPRRKPLRACPLPLDVRADALHVSQRGHGRRGWTRCLWNPSRASYKNQSRRPLPLLLSQRRHPPLLPCSPSSVAAVPTSPCLGGAPEPRRRRAAATPTRRPRRPRLHLHVDLAPLLLCHAAEAATTTTADSSRPSPRLGPRRGRVTASTASSSPSPVFGQHREHGAPPCPRLRPGRPRGCPAAPSPVPAHQP